jgi:hypothetical protein
MGQSESKERDFKEDFRNMVGPDPTFFLSVCLSCVFSESPVAPS